MNRRDEQTEAQLERLRHMVQNILETGLRRHGQSEDGEGIGESERAKDFEGGETSLERMTDSKVRSDRNNRVSALERREGNPHGPSFYGLGKRANGKSSLISRPRAIICSCHPHRVPTDIHFANCQPAARPNSAAGCPIGSPCFVPSRRCHWGELGSSFLTCGRQTQF